MTDPASGRIPSVRIPGPWLHREISANGIRLHIAECGAGPLVVLLHGFPEFWWSWRHQLVGLAAAGYRAVAVDLRGYGDSDKPPRGYDLWTLAGDVAGLIRALGERRAVVVGHDWGGLVGWTLAALHPRLVSSLVAVGAPHPLALRHAVWRHPRGQGRALARHAAGFQLPLRPERRLRADSGALVERLLRSWAGPDRAVSGRAVSGRAAQDWTAGPEFAEIVTRNRDAMAIPGVAHSALEYFRWAVRSQLRPDGQRFAADVRRPVPVPVLQIHGAADPWLLERTARASRRWTTREYYRYQALAGCGHLVHQQDPTGTTQLITDFLKETR